jgi:hypothetical protein
MDSSPPHTASTTASGAIYLHNLDGNKLTRENYNTWKATVATILKGHSLYGFVDGSNPCPSSIISTPSETGATVAPNPAYMAWNLQDQLIIGALTASLTESILSHVVKCTTSHEVWITLQRLFASHEKARTMQVHYQLATLKKGNSSIADYFQRFTGLTDSLAAVDQPINAFEAVSFLLADLGSDYDSFVTSVTTRVEPLAIEEIYGHLLAHEQRLQHHVSSVDVVDVTLAGANFVSRGRAQRGGSGGRSSGFNNGCGSSQPVYNRPYSHSPNYRGRGFGRGSNTSSSQRLICQVCNKPGHSAFDCHNRFNNNYHRDSSSNMQAFLAASNPLDNTTWYPDSGATHHMTSDLANLNLKTEEYGGSDHIRVGNGNTIPITHIGDAHISSSSFPFTLHNVLHVPNIQKNLISVHQFTKATNTFFEFHPFHFFLKDRVTGSLLLRGQSKNGLYFIPPFTASNKSHRPTALVGERTSIHGWHSRLGHPAFRVVRPLLSKFQLPFTNNKGSLACPACLSSKSHQLSFPNSHTCSLAPLELIYTDV